MLFRSPETYAFQDVMRAWMKERDIPYETVRYQAKRFKHWPPYRDLTENLLTNATLPSIAFGRGACSSKWKAAPQDAFLKTWAPAIETWEAGQRVVRYIGYDASPRDGQRYAHARKIDDPRYENRYPLRDWGWDRTRCQERIVEAGLPVPPKSSCVFCVAMKPDELRQLPRHWLRTIVLMEARAAHRLRTVEGLWRSSTKTRPGRMTDFIRTEGLLDPGEIDDIELTAPTDLIAFQERAARVPLAERPAMTSWLERFQQGA